jgi:hypothetical protein
MRSPVKRSSQIKPTSNEQTEQTLALLKIPTLGDRQIAAGEAQPAADVVAQLRERHATR